MTISIPYRDTPRTPLAFSLSVLLHVVLIVGLVAAFWFSPPPEKPKMVFTMVAVRSSDLAPNDMPTNATNAGVQMPDLATPNPLPPAPVEPPPPTPMPPTPQPPMPPTVPIKPLTPTPTSNRGNMPMLKTPAATGPKIIQYKDFRKTQSHGTVSATAPQATGRVVPTVGVDVGNIVKGLTKGGIASGQGHSTTVSSAQAEDYWAKVAARLKEAFEPPPGTSNLNAEIRLVIDGDGNVIFASLTRGSGSPVFDAAVRTVLKRVTNVDPPPGGVQVANVFVFSPSDN